MTPARKRARSYDSARTRAAVIAQFENVRDGVRTLTEEQLARPSGLGDWSVRELAAHITMAVGSVSRHLDLPAPAAKELALLDWPSGTASRAGTIADGTRALAEEHPDLDALYTDSAARIAGHLATAPDDRLLGVPAGAMTLADFLVTRTVELVVHTDDLNRAAGTGIPFDRQALAACTRLLADALAVKAPGASTEVRIPPYAVVQCVEGPRHTRGTPPNVVETDPLTWIRLATGRVAWKAALDEAKVSASGERADLGGLLPLMG
ncbi:MULTISPECIES: maleylpyruvate isomerase family mycothiol-dependent enzyme [Streptomyces]|uniref:Maleylpyruvate isomerase family mycothiol-dependent enzyme n=1 Tax=Streptomyces triticiradicis TaxID=2651189 RepID=A0A7J5D3Z7_9ACTN|nr:maleylpyruvate isomerase family mycothiol-dependent enzyme [Streptomyces triticiradicis]KAB1978716.1 maleylpyruvate isomerase family mycothiol-dependent enzyme [Streptomyces triticiradicis]